MAAIAVNISADNIDGCKQIQAVRRENINTKSNKDL